MRSRAAPLRASGLALCVLCLMGCAATPRVVVPEALRTCQAEPAPPGPEADDVALASWMADTIFAGRDCRGALARVVEMLR